MPYGIISDAISIFTGGLAGGLLSGRISQKLHTELNSVISAWILALSISLVVRMQVYAAVAASLLISCLIGYALNLEEKICTFVLRTSDRLFGNSKTTNPEKLAVLIVIMAFGGSGMAGAMAEATAADRTIILSRTVSDFFTAMLFGAELGPVACLSAIPALCSHLFFYFCANLLLPHITDTVYANFTGAAGVLALIGALKLFGISKAKPLNVAPIVFLIIPVTELWLKLF